MLKYQIFYEAVNTYEVPLREAVWQFIILPEDNDTQKLRFFQFSNSENIPYDQSVDGFLNSTIKLVTKKALREITFTAHMDVEKKEINPFQNIKNSTPGQDFKMIDDLVFKVDHEKFLFPTALTSIPQQFQKLFVFDRKETIFSNLCHLNQWSFEYFTFKTEVTTTESSITEILDQRKGVCQDFTHVFCGLARLNGVPARYVSGYLHQNNTMVGDLQMHAWVECYIPGTGWVGFDPTNNLLAATHHIKVTHGRDYQDCAPLKGVIYLTGSGNNKTEYTVRVKEVKEFKERTQQEYRAEDFAEVKRDLENRFSNPSYLKWQQQQQQQ
ncbi:transglutaminase-like domain-containing protein [Nonlabens xiamenensis]|uniref:transglutaminase-like domain-containing protein n=1 Tax=Nonlabens xiamenensis TaxID=2341043 RepID=UPI000F61003C|nr:transglutaminase family protein [Nonlabens xiamenensis]